MVKTVPRPGHEVSSLSSPLTPLALDAAGKWLLNRVIAAVGPTQLTRHATRPVAADDTTRADSAAVTTVDRVTVGIHAGPITAHLTGRTRGRLAGPAHTGLTRRADLTTGATVVGVTAGVHAAPVTGRLTRWTLQPAASIHTACAIVADVATGATVVVIAVRVHAAPVATACTILADGATGTTVVIVAAGVHAAAAAERTG